MSRDYRIEVLEKAINGEFPDQVNVGGELDYLLPAIFELRRSELIEAQLVEDEQGKPHTALLIQPNAFSRDYLKELKGEQTVGERKKRKLRPTVKRSIAAVGILISTIFVAWCTPFGTDVYNYIKGKCLPSTSDIYVSVEGTRYGFKLITVNRGEDTRIGYFGLQWYKDEESFKAGKPTATKQIYELGERQLPYELSKARRWEGAMHFSDFPPEIPKPKEGVLILEVHDNLAEKPIRKRIVFAEGP